MMNLPRRISLIGFLMKLSKALLIPAVLFLLTIVYLFPLLQGLILLPLDLLINNYYPWYSPATILLKNSYMQDSIIQLFPWRHLVFESLTKGIIPIWNPYQGLGMPFMANLKPMVFYPLNIFFIFGEIRAWNLLLISQIFLSMLFAYYLARDFKLKTLPSIFAGFAYGLNSYMIGLLEFGSDAHTLIWWPLIFLIAKKYLDKQRGIYLFGISLMFCFSIFAGQLQYLAYFMIIFLAFILYYGKLIKVKFHTYIFLFASIGTGFGLAGLQLLPSLELFSYSHRGLLTAVQNHDVFSRGLIPPYKLLRLFAPDFFGNPVTHDLSIGYIETSGYFGNIALFFAIFAMIFSRKKVIVKFLTAVFIISIFLSLQGIGELLYFLKIPIITNGSADRIFVLVIFSGPLLAAFGLSEFIGMKNNMKKYLSLLCFFVAEIVLIIIYIIFNRMHSSIPVLSIHNISFAEIILSVFVAGGIVYTWLRSRQTKFLSFFFCIFVLALTFFDLFRLGYRFLTFSNKKFLYPQLAVTKFITEASNKNLGRTFGIIEPELSTYLQIYSAETYNPLYLLRTSEALQALQNQKIGSYSNDNKFYLTSYGENLKRTIDFIGVKYIVTPNGVNPSINLFHSKSFQNDFQKVYTDDKFNVFQNANAFPRFDLYYTYQIYPKDTEQLAALSNAKIDLGRTLVLAQNPGIRLKSGNGFIKLLSSTINSQIFSVESSSPALFYISDTFYPGWHAQVNGKDTKIYRANYNFRAVVVPKGKSVLTFFYMPISFVLGIIISFLSMFILLVLCVFNFKYKSAGEMKSNSQA